MLTLHCSVVHWFVYVNLSINIISLSAIIGNMINLITFLVLELVSLRSFPLTECGLVQDFIFKLIHFPPM